jgi:hypothetical protein
MGSPRSIAPLQPAGSPVAVAELPECTLDRAGQVTRLIWRDAIVPGRLRKSFEKTWDSLLWGLEFLLPAGRLQPVDTEDIGGRHKGSRARDTDCEELGKNLPDDIHALYSTQHDLDRSKADGAMSQVWGFSPTTR